VGKMKWTGTRDMKAVFDRHEMRDRSVTKRQEIRQEERTSEIGWLEDPEWTEDGRQ